MGTRIVPIERDETAVCSLNDFLVNNDLLFCEVDEMLLGNGWGSLRIRVKYFVLGECAFLINSVKINSCTKRVDSPGLTHDRTLDCHPVSWAWMHG